jgi:hypothetical protein
MKKLLVSVLFLTLLSLAAFAQESRNFPVSGFNKLTMGSAFKVEVKQGSKFSVTASGRSEDLEDMEARVSGGTLKLGFKDGSWGRNRKTVHVSITMPALQAVDFSGATKVDVGRFSGVSNMDIEVSGASQVRMEFNARKVNMDLSGASSLILLGQCEVLNGEVSGASSFKGNDFPAKEVNIDASGASSAAVVASSVIHAEASGASSIKYSGSAKNIHSSSSGASSIKRH